MKARGRNGRGTSKEEDFVRDKEKAIGGRIRKKEEGRSWKT